VCDLEPTQSFRARRGRVRYLRQINHQWPLMTFSNRIVGVIGRAAGVTMLPPGSDFCSARNGHHSYGDGLQDVVFVAGQVGVADAARDEIRGVRGMDADELALVCIVDAEALEDAMRNCDGAEKWKE
jgi:hypothetical protein